MTKEEVIDIIKDAGFGFLATSEGQQPRVRPMSPVLTDAGRLLLALLPQCRTIPQIKENPQVELCWVDRKMSYCRMTGKATMTEDLENKKLLWDTVPSMKQYFSGPEDPNFHLVEIEVQGVEAMTPHQQQPEVVAF